jgi:putative pyruvate formate lyase activating enzyme
MDYTPPYLDLYKTGELQKRISCLNHILVKCELCPRGCQVNRLKGELGFCRAGAKLMVSSAFPHFGEEAPLVGNRGSGTIFFTHCNLRCVFCQNYDISHQGNGEIISSEQLAGYMVALQERGCHNINFVTPTHYLPQIIASLPYAIDLGLHIPLVYNCGGYESLGIIKLLEGVIDIYMPDVKFADRAVAEKYADAPDYPEAVKAVLHEMHRQVGDLTINGRGIAERGLLMRHLVMPQGLAGTRDVMQFIASEISSDAYVNIMNQYRPEYKSCNFPELNRGITLKEYSEAITFARHEGLSRGFDQA